MQYKGFQDIELSRLGMGNMRLPEKHALGLSIDRVKAQEIIDYAMESGINYYDTAHVYNAGDSERFLGEAMQKYPRDSYYLATKFFWGAAFDYRKMFEKQLERLKTDHIDFYLMHCIMDHTANKYIKGGAVAYFEEQKKLGRIKYLGFSSHSSPKCLKKFAEAADWDFAQIQLNYFDWQYGTAKQEYEILTEKNIPVMVMESVRGGKLADLGEKANAMLKQREPDKSIASWAFRFLATLPNVQVALSGMSTLEQIKDNVATYEDLLPLNEEEMQTLMHACDVFHRGMAVPCTGCRYCTEGCPKKIDIPKVMSLYNVLKTEGDEALKKRLAESGEELKIECVGCKACERHCPQGIKVASIMKEMGKA